MAEAEAPGDTGRSRGAVPGEGAIRAHGAEVAGPSGDDDRVVAVFGVIAAAPVSASVVVAVVVVVVPAVTAIVSDAVVASDRLGSRVI